MEHYVVHVASPREFADAVRPVVAHDADFGRIVVVPSPPRPTATKRRFVPGYVIVEMNLDERTREILIGHGASSFVGDPTPMPLSAKEVEKLDRMLAGEWSPPPPLVWEEPER